MATKEKHAQNRAPEDLLKIIKRVDKLAQIMEHVPSRAFDARLKKLAATVERVAGGRKPSR